MARVIVIPARLESARLPRKLLLADTGRPLIQHTYQACGRSVADRVVVAADGPEIADAVREFGGEVVVTDPALPSGTDRVAAAAKELGLGDDDLVVNVQGDEPEIEPSHIATLFDLLLEDAAAAAGRVPCAVATLATPRTDGAGFVDPNRVKVVVDASGRALYFSRASIPFPRDLASGSGNLVWENTTEPLPWLCHVGIYGFRPGALRAFTETPPTPLERRERLEQLRFLELGFGIRVGRVDGAAPGIDTPADYQRFVRSCLFG